MTEKPWSPLDIPGRRIGYARVSTPDQKLRMQLDALKYARCERIFRDHGVSGGKASRPGLDRALAVLQPGDGLVVLKLDRLGRSVSHLASLLTRFHDREIHFCSLTEGINTTTPGGKLVFHIIAAVAEFQRDIIRENTCQGIEAARRRGKQIGRPHALDLEAILATHRDILENGTPIHIAAQRLKVSHATLGRAFKRIGLIGMRDACS
ncbi:DNA-invertase hin [Methyloligella halotolerans]|uniref:DNA-invertase hin n=1 Tax=Methyloligella halotolerans TaxID=1177755 RepID=A0A1E2RWS0_9HYPH|nr:recombinase family protein [Methyloligella halotolerans]ODA66592.1 DNA-invertase hin [Methyloligella halotolerans]